MSDLIRREDALALRDKLADIIGALPMSSIHSALSEYRNAIRALPAVQPGKEVMPDGTSKVWNHDAAPASTDDAGGGATREEVAEALWQADRVTLYSQLRPRFSDIESYNRNHWLMMADVAIETIKGGKK